MLKNDPFWAFVAHCSLLIAYCLPCYAAPMHPVIVQGMPARGETRAISCPSSVGNLWAKVASRRYESSVSAQKFLAPNRTIVDTDPSTPDTILVAFLLVQFQTDASAATTDSGMFPEFAADGTNDTRTVVARAETMAARLDTFYKAVSYRRLRIIPTVFGDSLLVTVSNGMATYMNSASSPTGLDDLLREVFRRVDTSVNFARYDVVVVLHAGLPQQLGSSSLQNIPAQFVTLSTADSFSGQSPGETVTQAVLMALDGAAVSGETVTMFGTLAHEFGHSLGLPDLYNTSAGTLGIGNWGLMGTGNYLGTPQGDSPSFLDAWSRAYLNWSDTKELDSTTAITSFDTKIYKAESDSRIFVIYPKKSVNTEYFLIEHRNPSIYGIDTAIGPGLLIWHIDNTVGSIVNNTVNATNNNTAADHGRVVLEAANGRYASSISTPLSALTDPWPSSSQDGFGDNSSPTSRGYGDTIARFAIKSISASSDTASFTVDFSSVSVSVSSSSVKYPSSCVAWRFFSSRPAVMGVLRFVRDGLLYHSFGRHLVERYYR